MTLVAALALTAAFLFALAALLQQRAARAAVTGDQPPVSAALDGIRALMHSLLRSRSWLLGWLANISGFMTQATALHLGSVATVQPWMATQLLFALPLASFERRRVPRALDWLWVLLVCAGLVLFLRVQRTDSASGVANRPSVLLATASAAGAVAVLVISARRASTRTASLLVAVAAGLCFAMSAVFMKLTAEDLLGPGPVATALDWPGYCLALSAVSGLLLEQAAFAGGPLPWAVAGMSVTNPVASLTVGLLAFHVPVPDDPGSLAAIAGAGALVAIGISGLAHSPAMRQLYGRPAWTEPAATGEPPHPGGGPREDGDPHERPAEGHRPAEGMG